MLHFLYMIAEEYTVKGMPDFYHSVNQMEGDFQWTDLLKYLPNPTGERLPDRISGFNVIPLLPTYAVGFLWKEYVLSLNQNGVEIARTEVTDSSLVLEHQIRSTHMVVGKFFVRDVKVVRSEGVLSFLKKIYIHIAAGFCTASRDGHGAPQGQLWPPACCPL